MSDTIISVERLSKRYKLGQIGATTLRDSVERWLARMRAARLGAKCKVESEKSDPSTLNLAPYTAEEPDSPDGELWALRDVSFEVKRGEVLGIIGRNGAGKSTLLKILSRITEPTSGRAIMRGRVASLLEVGTGFHPELTGRENIYLNGAILGMRHREITAKFDEIVAFAEVDKFIDTPVKRYSSGMYVRLAFAVAAHLDPEILLVDEVLAVGDAAFQKRCLGKMSKVAHEGKTVLFVSHNMTAVKAMCTTGIWLDAGGVRFSGNTEQAVDEYLQSSSGINSVRRWDPGDPLAPGDERVRLREVRVGPVVEDLQALTVKSSICVSISFLNQEGSSLLNFSAVLYKLDGTCIFNTTSEPQKLQKGIVRGNFIIPGDLLNSGIYTIRLLIVKDTSSVLIDEQEVASFEVLDEERQGSWYGRWIGAVRPKLEWCVSQPTERNRVSEL